MNDLFSEAELPPGTLTITITPDECEFVGWVMSDPAQLVLIEPEPESTAKPALAGLMVTYRDPLWTRR